MQRDGDGWQWIDKGEYVWADHEAECADIQEVLCRLGAAYNRQ